MKNLIGLAFSVIILLLTACGGGGSTVSAVGSGSLSQPTATYTTLVNTSNGQGVARGVTDTFTSLVYSSEITTFVSGANSPSGTAPTNVYSDLNASNFPVVQSTSSYALRKGTIPSGGATINMSILQNTSTPNVMGLYFEIPGTADTLMVIGATLKTPPVDGALVYTGTFTQNARAVVAPGAFGTFSLKVNVPNKTFTILGTTSTMSLSGSGVIDMVSGLFAASNLSIGVSGTNYSGTIYGNLHGENASVTSGVFYTNDSVHSYSGSFIGSR